jgi:hypothetical protein
MNQMRLTKLAIAGSTVACAALFSFSWSEQRRVSLSVESAQARVGRPLTPVSVAGVARRHNRRAAYGYASPPLLPSEGSGGLNAYSTGFAGAAAAGTAVAATSPNWGWGGGPYYTGANAYYAAPTASPSSGWYITPNGMACTSGTLVTGANGLPFRCP